MTNLTQEDIDNIKAIRAAITPGEWFPKLSSWTIRTTEEDDYTPLVADAYNNEDTIFIANAPQYVDDLVEDVERLTKQAVAHKLEMQSKQIHTEDLAEENLRLRDALKAITEYRPGYGESADTCLDNIKPIARKALKGGEE